MIQMASSVGGDDFVDKEMEGLVKARRSFVEGGLRGTKGN